MSMPSIRHRTPLRFACVRLSGFPFVAASVLICALWCAAAGAEPPSAGSVPSFKNDVMAVISKAGCNMGACHGNQNGKGGFRLSLRGQDPDFDYTMLTREFASRRIDLLEPERSLMLLKPSGGLAHQGGVRFHQNSPHYALLRDWIAAGCPAPKGDAPRLEELTVSPSELVVAEPADSVQLKVSARLTGGEVRDVTSLAVYETANSVVTVSAGGLVERQSLGETTVVARFLDRQAAVQLAFIPARPGFTWNAPPARNYIDELIDARLRELRMNPSPPADDHVFVRRAFLDACGILPTAEEARDFVADASPGKRERLIDELLARPEFAEHWALKWGDVLRNEEKVLDETGVQAFHDWICDSMAGGKPIDQFVRELVTGRGSTYKQPEANFYRANRDPLTRGETAARLFLGTRLGCARCHNHPFEHWTQDDYYSWAAVFARIDYEIGDNKRRDKLDKNEFVGEQIVVMKDEGEVTNARTGETAPPKLLGGPMLDLGTNGGDTNGREANGGGSKDGDGKESDGKESDGSNADNIEDGDAKADRLAPLAEWLTSPDNKLFARTQANFIWYHVMGRGLVEPIDDFRETNPGVNPELLDALAADFVAHGFDLRHLVRRIMTSRTYQLSSVPNATNADDQASFSRAIVRRLTAEQLLDAQSQTLDAPARFGGYPMGLRAGQLPGVYRVRPRELDEQRQGDRFLRTFGKSDRLLACECERSNETTLSQAFTLISGGGLNERLGREGNRLDRLARSGRPAAEIVEELYWNALQRGPTDAERQSGVALLESAGDDRFAALQDFAWALLNAKEFVFRH